MPCDGFLPPRGIAFEETVAGKRIELSASNELSRVYPLRSDQTGQCVK